MNNTKHTNNCFQTGIFNQRMIDAIVMFIPYTTHGYYKNWKTPYVLEVADNGELLVWEKDLTKYPIRIDTSNFKKVFISRIGKLVKWILKNANQENDKEIVWTENEFPIGRFCDNEFDTYDLSNGYRFSEWTKHHEIRISCKDMTCLYKKLQNKKKEKLIEEFGEEFLEQVIGTPRNPIESFKANLCNKVYFESMNEYQNKCLELKRESWKNSEDSKEFAKKFGHYDEMTYRQTMNQIYAKKEEVKKEFKNKMSELYNKYMEVF